MIHNFLFFYIPIAIILFTKDLLESLNPDDTVNDVFVNILNLGAPSSVSALILLKPIVIPVNELEKDIGKFVDV